MGQKHRAESREETTLTRFSQTEVTPRKTNRSPESEWLEDVFPIEIYPKKYRQSLSQKRDFV